jgi:hypothetical protein
MFVSFNTLCSMNRILIVCAISIFTISACVKSSCGGGPLYVRFSGFDSTELSMIVVNRYEPNGSFATRVHADTLNLTKSESVVNGVRAQGRTVYLAEGHDWELIMPIAGKAARITELKLRSDKGDGDMGGKASSVCYSGWDYTYNGEKRSTPRFGSTGVNDNDMPVISK